MKVLGIMGEAGCGKSTFAQALIERHGYRSFSFAGALKDLCATLYGWERARLDELAYKESPSGHNSREYPPLGAISWTESNQFGESPLEQDRRDFIAARLREMTTAHTRRQILQHVGTELFRALDPEHWIKKAREVFAAAGPDARFVIPDMRFPNEADLVREFGGDLVLIERLDGQGPGTAHGGHASEQAWRAIEPTYSYGIAYGLGNVAAAAEDYAQCAAGNVYNTDGHEAGCIGDTAFTRKCAAGWRAGCRVAP